SSPKHLVLAEFHLLVQWLEPLDTSECPQQGRKSLGSPAELNDRELGGFCLGEKAALTCGQVRVDAVLVNPPQNFLGRRAVAPLDDGYERETACSDLASTTD